MSESPSSGTHRAAGQVGVVMPPSPVAHRHPRILIAARILVTLVSLSALVLTGTVWNYIRSTNNDLTIVEALDMGSDDVRSIDDQAGDETFLVVGVDSRAGINAQIGGTGWMHEGARSDTIMLVTVPADRRRVVAVSFPRDLNITRPSCQRFDNDSATYSEDYVPSERNVKLNDAYYTGGPKCLIKAVQRISGMNINRFVGIDFAGFQDMVDTIGGVEVCVTQPMWDDELGLIIPEAGRQVINGPTALDYVRARHVPAEGTNDYGRMHRQQVLLSSLLREVLSSRVLLDPTKLNSFIEAFVSHTFVENVDSESLLMLARSMQGVDAGQVTFLTIPTAGPNEQMNEIPRDRDVDAIFDAIIYDWPLPGEEDPAPSNNDNTDDAPAASSGDAQPAAGQDEPRDAEAEFPSQVSVQVSNGSRTFGLAGNAASALAGYGFQIYSVGDHSRVLNQTVIRYSEGNEAEAATLASSFSNAVLQERRGLGSIVEVILGTDFDASISAPASPGTMVSIMDDGAVVPQVPLPDDLSVTNAGDLSCT
ncbi:LCP family protein [Lolliginicoccus suaedae]|uniref:LCP family protein n=1 Tax=Lolliginicoccus suaedae TaxID=2605429 RepID=UPI0011EF76C5|nr:LCP family protein [Lolliginicoccus suaedae]